MLENWRHRELPAGDARGCSVVTGFEEVVARTGKAEERMRREEALEKEMTRRMESQSAADDVDDSVTLSSR